MMTITAERIAELRRLRLDVTPGSLGWSTVQNAEYVSAMFNAMPELLDAAEELLSLREILTGEDTTRCKEEGHKHHYQSGAELCALSYEIDIGKARIQTLEAACARKDSLLADVPRVYECVCHAASGCWHAKIREEVGKR